MKWLEIYPVEKTINSDVSELHISSAPAVISLGGMLSGIVFFYQIWAL